MRRMTLVGVSVLLAVAAAAALDDITTGSEPSLVAEWIVVSAAAVWGAGLLLTAVARR